MENESSVWKINACDGELARAYVPFQKLHELYTPEDGLKKGTVFPELSRPYHGRGRECGCNPQSLSGYII